MGKRPRLKFFGVEATFKELLVLADAHTYTTNPATDKWCGGNLFVKSDQRYTGYAFGETIALMHEHGFLEYRKGYGNYWTPFARRYIAAVMRNNPRLRLKNTWQFEKRQRKRIKAQRKIDLAFNGEPLTKWRNNNVKLQSHKRNG